LQTDAGFYCSRARPRRSATPGARPSRPLAGGRDARAPGKPMVALASATRIIYWEVIGLVAIATPVLMRPNRHIPALKIGIELFKSSTPPFISFEG
jgi:hypothetical protein